MKLKHENAQDRTVGSNGIFGELSNQTWKPVSIQCSLSFHSKIYVQICRCSHINWLGICDHGFNHTLAYYTTLIFYGTIMPISFLLEYSAHTITRKNINEHVIYNTAICAIPFLLNIRHVSVLGGYCCDMRFL
jgi:hypothetical protein